MKSNRKIRLRIMFPAVIAISSWMISCGVFDPIDPYVSFRHWAMSYGGSRDEELNSVAAGDDGSLYAAGRTATFGAGDGDAWLIKTMSNGAIEWQKAYRYGDYASETFRKIRLSPDGCLTVLCDIVENGNQSFALMNIDEVGNVSWYHLYDGNKFETALDCIRTPITLDGYLVTGYINSLVTSIDSSGHGDAFLLAVDNQGIFRWQKIYGGSNFDEARVVLPARDGGIYLAGNTTSYGYGKSDYWLIKTKKDRPGEIEWQKAFGGAGDEFLSTAVVTSDNTILLAGISTSTEVITSVQQRNSVYWVLCLDEQGGIKWQKTYHDPRDRSVLGSSTVCAIRESTIQGRYLFTLSAAVDGDGPDYCLLILKNDGSIQSQKRYGGSGSDQVKEVVYMQDHCAVAVGSTGSYGGGNDFWLLKTLPNLKCDPLTRECGFIENAAGGIAVATNAETKAFSSNLLEQPNIKTWTITDTQCAVQIQAP
jgi:hypothetical protein